MTQHIRLTALTAAVFAALALAACDQSPSSKNSASVTPPKSTDSSSTAQSSTPPQSTAMDSQSPSQTPSQPAAGDKFASATDDAAVTTKVKAALLAEPGLRSMEIHVDTKDGVVTLTGTPDSAASRDKAVVVARNVTGVKDVVDQMASKS